MEGKLWKQMDSREEGIGTGVERRQISDMHALSCRVQVTPHLLLRSGVLLVWCPEVLWFGCFAPSFVQLL